MRDLYLQRFGRLVANHPIKKRAKNGNTIWLCRCDCGNPTEVRISNLVSGHTKSCGCLQKEYVATFKYATKHGDKAGGKCSRLYRIWTNMKYRCLAKTSPDYKYYGGRGVSICDEWKNECQNFKTWALTHGYLDNLTIDRINNDGNYEPSNYNWLTRQDNAKKARQAIKGG